MISYTINEVLAKMAEMEASDLHITVGVPPTVRLNGHLMPLENYDVLNSDDTRDLVLPIMNDEQRKKLDDIWECDFSYMVPDVARFRVNVYFQKTNIAAAFRIIPIKIKTLEELNLPHMLHEMIQSPRGFICVTGPTGSGKSTTLAAMVNEINLTRTEHIISIEDPIEFLHNHQKSLVNQREVGLDTKSFSNALKYVLRQDPDVILVGEMRDLETITAALTAAETGHLVFATLHTQDAPQTIDRIIDVFPPHQQEQVRIQLAGSLQGVISQQLLPTKDGNGRACALEILIPTPAVRNLIREGKTHQIYSVMQTGQKYGMQTMDSSLADLYNRGKITYEMALMKASDQENLKGLIGRGPGY
jgi:twitching motility protein PilT